MNSLQTQQTMSRLPTLQINRIRFESIFAKNGLGSQGILTMAPLNCQSTPDPVDADNESVSILK